MPLPSITTNNDGRNPPNYLNKPQGSLYSFNFGQDNNARPNNGVVKRNSNFLQDPKPFRWKKPLPPPPPPPPIVETIDLSDILDHFGWNNDSKTHLDDDKGFDSGDTDVDEDQPAVTVFLNRDAQQEESFPKIKIKKEKVTILEDLRFSKRDNNHNYEKELENPDKNLEVVDMETSSVSSAESSLGNNVRELLNHINTKASYLPKIDYAKSYIQNFDRIRSKSESHCALNMVLGIRKSNQVEELRRCSSLETVIFQEYDVGRKKVAESSLEKKQKENVLSTSSNTDEKDEHARHKRKRNRDHSEKHRRRSKDSKRKKSIQLLFGDSDDERRLKEIRKELKVEIQRLDSSELGSQGRQHEHTKEKYHDAPRNKDKYTDSKKNRQESSTSKESNSSKEKKDTKSSTEKVSESSKHKDKNYSSRYRSKRRRSSQSAESQNLQTPDSPKSKEKSSRSSKANDKLQEQASKKKQETLPENQKASTLIDSKNKSSELNEKNLDSHNIKTKEQLPEKRHKPDVENQQETQVSPKDKLPEGNDKSQDLEKPEIKAQSPKSNNETVLENQQVTTSTDSNDKPQESQTGNEINRQELQNTVATGTSETEVNNVRVKIERCDDTTMEINFDNSNSISGASPEKTTNQSGQATTQAKEMVTIPFTSIDSLFPSASGGDTLSMSVTNDTSNQTTNMVIVPPPVSEVQRTIESMPIPISAIKVEGQVAVKQENVQPSTENNTAYIKMDNFVGNISVHYIEVYSQFFITRDTKKRIQDLKRQCKQPTRMEDLLARNEDLFHSVMDEFLTAVDQVSVFDFCSKDLFSAFTTIVDAPRKVHVCVIITLLLQSKLLVTSFGKLFFKEMLSFCISESTDFDDSIIASLKARLSQVSTNLSFTLDSNFDDKINAIVDRETAPKVNLKLVPIEKLANPSTAVNEPTTPANDELVMNFLSMLQNNNLQGSSQYNETQNLENYNLPTNISQYTQGSASNQAAVNNIQNSSTSGQERLAPASQSHAYNMNQWAPNVASQWHTPVSSAAFGSTRPLSYPVSQNSIDRIPNRVPSDSCSATEMYAAYPQSSTIQIPTTNTQHNRIPLGSQISQSFHSSTQVSRSYSQQNVQHSVPQPGIAFMQVSPPPQTTSQQQIQISHSQSGLQHTQIPRTSPQQNIHVAHHQGPYVSRPSPPQTAYPSAQVPSIPASHQQSGNAAKQVMSRRPSLNGPTIQQLPNPVPSQQQRTLPHAQQLNLPATQPISNLERLLLSNTIPSQHQQRTLSNMSTMQHLSNSLPLQHQGLLSHQQQLNVPTTQHLPNSMPSQQQQQQQQHQRSPPRQQQFNVPVTQHLSNAMPSKQQQRSSPPREQSNGSDMIQQALMRQSVISASIQATTTANTSIQKSMPRLLVDEVIVSEENADSIDPPTSDDNYSKLDVLMPKDGPSKCLCGSDSRLICACRKVTYCSVICQQNYWKRHEKECPAKPLE